VRPVAFDRDEWMRRLGPLYPAAVAARNVTALPWRGLDPTGGDLARSALWLPVVGGAIGAIAAAAAVLVGATGIAPALAGSVAVAVALALGGAGRERELARSLAGDRSDAGLGLGERDELALAPLLAILGAVALRAVALLVIATPAWPAALISAGAIGHWSAVFLSRIGDRVDDAASIVGDERTGLAAGEPGWPALGIATAITAVAAIALGGASGAIAFAVAAALAFGLGLLLQRRRGGVGRDSLGAVCIACELAVLAVFAALHPAAVSAWVAR
jgi:adenosylcobinamide-GDP ribazoletransferase